MARYEIINEHDDSCEPIETYASLGAAKRRCDQLTDQTGVSHIVCNRDGVCVYPTED